MTTDASTTGQPEPARLHPRPQLTRKQWLDLDGDWEFRFDDEDRGLDAGWWRRDVPFDRIIRVPYPPESALSGVGEDGHAIVWYRRTATLVAPPGHRMLLHFAAVDHRADVWVNGVHVGAHEGGHVGFCLDVTHALGGHGDTADAGGADAAGGAGGAGQTIVVRVFDDPRSLEQPRGKQDWEPEPHVIWYRRTTGIWRQVWAEAVPSTHLASVRWTPGARPGEIALDARVAGQHGRVAQHERDARVAVEHGLNPRAAVPEGQADDPALTLEAVFRHDGQVLGSVAVGVVDGRARASLDLVDPRFTAEPHRLLWSPEHPTLIDVELTLRHGDATLDRAGSYVGLRTVATEDGRFLLNGRPTRLRLVLEQAYWPQSHLAAPDDDALRREVELTKSFGFTGIRMHQTVADPRFLYWCDRLGLLVWADAPAAYRFSSLTLERTTGEWMEIVARDASHPCVVAWVAFNESWGVPDVATDESQRNAVRGLTGLIKALDPSRPVIGNDGWEWVAGDLIGVHDYTHDGAVLRSRYEDRTAVEATLRHGRPGGRRLLLSDADDVRDLPVVLSEFGGVGFHTSTADWEGYGAVTDEDAFVARLRDLVGAVHDSTGLAGFCWTQLTDTLQEKNGLLDEHRRPKAALALLRAIITGEDR
ncbi:hypothetical protein BKD30_04655 [Tersicoccus phoenicis]|uniref:Glycoside hydrolase family 2 catalytic domain-containing protein n=1 Tax=Tersicoccus phoenicis TaxID=554083 RepID=A0A1R1LGM2_9MICC|nr:sugar-binding domain-containing protein [Tersicoccus phoenicis]OMH26684.1 hypothetical protein BKD30_04655 [Tersicoccus phoenicis]